MIATIVALIAFWTTLNELVRLKRRYPWFLTETGVHVVTTDRVVRRFPGYFEGFTQVAPDYLKDVYTDNR